MENVITKDDLRQFGMVLMNDIRQQLQSKYEQQDESLHPEWLKSKVVRKLLDMSAGTLQTLRISGKIRSKKILGSYYYNKEDLLNLFNE
ncbi:helix-turn-helix domain-containing protein [Flavobacterium zepuense]|uniref:Helix-turn-helix domain-containing protein n=1 Tax=Flavobacterium zepuense TaxID=2593302 RepID=A0A552V198_9FLAO|nr:helix-turn-helix domain-containing protein [Flavobacterium zepuense]TRW24230.1 helix-turn-helix domain-containing protein [Flavobacterium zepuense]